VWCSISDKKLQRKSKDEQMAEKKQELAKRLQDVTGQQGSTKKPPKKGELVNRTCAMCHMRGVGCLKGIRKHFHYLKLVSEKVKGMFFLVDQLISG
jgi:cytochrome c5